MGLNASYSMINESYESVDLTMLITLFWHEDKTFYVLEKFSFFIFRSLVGTSDQATHWPGAT